MILRFLKNHRNSILASIFIAGTFFLLGFAYKYHLPRFESWLLTEIEKGTERHSDLRVHPENLSFQLFPLGIRLSNVKILPKPKLQKMITPTSVKEVEVTVSIFPLFQGQLRLSRVSVDGLDLNSLLHKKYLNDLIDSQKKNSNEQATEDEKQAKTKKKAQFGLSFLKDLPIDTLELLNINLLLSNIDDADQPVSQAQIRNLNMTIENKVSAALVDLTLPELYLQLGENKKIVKLYSHTRFLVSEESINLTAFKLKFDRSFFVGSGYLEGHLGKGQFDSFTGKIRTQVHLEDFPSVLKHLIKKEVPELKGQVLLESSVQIKPKTSPTAVFNVKTTGLKINHYNINNLKAKGTIDENSLQVRQLNVSNRAGSFKVMKFKLGLKENMPISGEVSSVGLELRKLLESIGAGTAPLNLGLKGQLPCSGSLKPSFNLRCEGAIEGNQFLVHSGSEERKNIVKINNMGAKGYVLITDKMVEYEAGLTIKENKGSSKGRIDYEKGFDIHYETPKVKISDIESLVDLKMEGDVSLKGRTFGDSSFAEIDMNIRGNDFWLEDYGLGKPRARLTYKKGFLYFKNLRGNFNSSQYKGNININLLKSRIWIKAQSNYLDLKDVKGIFRRKVDIPIDLTGTGNLSIEGSGPLEFKKLSYDMSGQLYRGSIVDEAYDELNFALVSKKGFVKTRQLILKRGDSLAHMDAEVAPNGSIKAYIVASNFRLEQLNTIKTLGLNLKGRLDTIATLSGQILDPDVYIEGHTTNVLIGSEPQEESRFKLKVTKEELSGVGNFLGETIRADFLVPFTLEKPSHFKINTKQWNFLKLFNLVSETSVKRNYNSRLDLNLNISAPRGGFWNSSGQLVVNQFLVSRGDMSLNSQNPMIVNFEKGVLSSQNFEVKDSLGNFARLYVNNLSQKKLSAKLEAQLDLGLGLILTPLEELGGQLNASIELGGSADKPHAIGNAIIKNGAAEISGFPHPFENVNADLLFSEQRIIINAARGSLGGGDVRGTGSIEFKGYKNIPINIKGEFTNVSLEVPKDYKTKGSGNIYVAGSWFPYELGGNYNVTSGAITSEFTANNKTATSIKPSLFLPKVLSEQSFEPLVLKLNIDILQPIEVKNSVALAPVTGKILVTDSPAYPRLTGKVDIQKGGRIQFRENEFELDTSSINFNNSPPENPTLDINASTQLESESITYEVSLRILGEAENPQIKLSSTPPLQELDLVTLLAFGITREELDNKDVGDVATQNAYQIGSALLASPLGKQLKSKYGIDLQIGSEEVSDDSSSEGTQTVPKVTLRKKINNKLEASASRTLGKAPRTNAKFEYKVNSNFSVIGFYDTIDQNESTEENENDDDTLGIDLEYKIQFK